MSSGANLSLSVACLALLQVQPPLHAGCLPAIALPPLLTTARGQCLCVYPEAGESSPHVSLTVFASQPVPEAALITSGLGVAGWLRPRPLPTPRVSTSDGTQTRERRGFEAVEVPGELTDSTSQYPPQRSPVSPQGNSQKQVTVSTWEDFQYLSRTPTETSWQEHHD